MERNTSAGTGANKIRSLVSSKQWKDNIDLQSVDEAWAGVLRYTAETNDPKLDVIRWELGVRRGNVNYQHSQTVSEFDTAFVHSNYYNAELSQKLVGINGFPPSMTNSSGMHPKMRKQF